MPSVSKRSTSEWRQPQRTFSRGFAGPPVVLAAGLEVGVAAFFPGGRPRPSLGFTPFSAGLAIAFEGVVFSSAGRESLVRNASTFRAVRNVKPFCQKKTLIFIGIHNILCWQVSGYNKISITINLSQKCTRKYCSLKMNLPTSATCYEYKRS